MSLCLILFKGFAWLTTYCFFSFHLGIMRCGSQHSRDNTIIVDKINILTKTLLFIIDYNLKYLIYIVSCVLKQNKDSPLFNIHVQNDVIAFVTFHWVELFSGRDTGFIYSAIGLHLH